MQDKIISWMHYNPVRVISNAGIIESLYNIVPPGKILIVTDSWFTSSGEIDRVKKYLLDREVVIHDRVLPNPELDAIDLACQELKSNNFECIIALGGGSVIDTAKAIAVLLAGESSSTLGDIFRNNKKPEWHNSLFLIAIPTTAGTGSEVTPFATVWDSVTGKKFSIAGDFVYPSVALLDPELTIGLPESITLHTGLDALSHSLESLWNKNRTPASIGFAMSSLSLIIESLPYLIKGENSIQLRAKLQWASTLAGMAISQTRTALAHSISYPVTLKLGAPHGLAASFTLEALLDVYLENNPGSSFDLEILNSIKNFLITLDLKKLILKYGTAEDIIVLIPKMYEPSRADNYSFEVDEKFIYQIVGKSLAKDK
jgi:alcohol dehydrogenase